ncbi:MAG TPA: hypothetical protein VH331_16610 [Allosphingosinicella sp.]|jgi:hypothetical protein|nr:hypothetical protein [Allosphingosinicella sp.]
MSASMNGAPWTAGDVQRLRRLAKKGLSAHDIAEDLRRTYSGVVKKAVLERLSLSGRRPSRAH